MDILAEQSAAQPPTLDTTALRAQILAELRSAIIAKMARDHLTAAAFEARAREAAGLSIPPSLRRGKAPMTNGIRADRSQRLPAAALFHALVSYCEFDPEVSNHLLDLAREVRANRRRPAHNPAKSEHRTCANCGKQVVIGRSVSEEWRTCSRACRNARALDHIRPKSVLKEELVRHMKNQRLDISTTAKALEVSTFILRGWLTTKGRTFREKNLRAVSALLGVSFEQAKDWDGGRTWEEKNAALRPPIEVFRLMPGTAEYRQAMAKVGSALRGRQRPQEVRDKIRTTRIARGVTPGTAVLARWKAVQGRITQPLFTYLQRHPNPAMGDVLSWATAVSARLNCPSRAVLEVWRPHLEKRGIATPATPGRKPAQRCESLRQLRERWTHDEAESVGGSFWDWAGGQLNAGAETLRRWDIEHRKQCPLCRTAVEQAPLQSPAEGVRK